MDALRPALERGLRGLGVADAGGLGERLLAYLALLHKWNRAYNLTAVRQPAQMVPRHLLDSLAVLPYVTGPRVLDVGSGPGLPGIPLALARPDWQVTLLDSNGKKTRFLRQAVLELELGNVTISEQRVEDYRPEEGFDSVISRAFAELGEFAALARPLCRSGGRLLAMKGPLVQDELRRLAQQPYTVTDHRLRLPELDAERHLVELVPL